MSVTVSKAQIDEIINELINYQKFVERTFPENSTLKYTKTYWEFLIDSKTEQLIDQLIKREKEFNIELLIVEESQENIFYDSELLLEWEQYKNIPKTNLTYRYDKGENKPGNEDHIHVYLGNTKNQVYAINMGGTPHDGSKAKLSNKEIKFLKSIGFTPPANGILEWFTLLPDTNYIAYKRFLLFD